MRELQKAGWREIIGFPEWKVETVVAKLDTGARSSCIDARTMRVAQEADGEMVHFTMATPHGDIECIEPILRWRNVRDSGAHVAKRPVIKVRVTMGPHEWLDEATLYDRSEMKNQVILGRRVLAKRFLVDSGKRFILTKPPHDEAAGGEPENDAVEDGALREGASDDSD